MSARIFQSVLIQLRDAAPRVIGVSDDKGSIVACTDLTKIGSVLDEFTGGKSADIAEHEFTRGDRTFRILQTGGGQYDYVVFVEGDDETARTLCRFAYVAVSEAKLRFDENNDRSAFVRSILSENVLISDIPTRAKDLRLETDAERACLLVRLTGTPSASIMDILREVFPDKNTDFVIGLNTFDTVVVTELHSSDPDSELVKIANQTEKRIAEIGDIKFVVGVGTSVRSLLRLADSYKEAQVAIDVGRVFDTERSLIFYVNLGLGRLIYQLPTRLCEMFLSEVFKKNPIEALDQETLFTIYRFFENNLNVSETSRRLFVHRNTLVYRLEKIKKLTGLDLREFDHAIVFKVALMVKRYLAINDTRS